MPTRPIASALASASLLLAFPALAHEGAPPLPELTHGGMVQSLPPQPVEVQFAYSAEERDAWLAECRSRYSDNGLGGALIGGVIGGIAGHQIAGSGDKVLGTVVGATAGAMAGAAIDGAEDAGRADVCDDYLARYEAGFRSGYGQQHAYGAYDGGYGYGAPVMWVPVRIRTHRHGAGCGCAKERVVEEWIEEEVIEAPVKTVPVAPPASKTVPLKPVK